MRRFFMLSILTSIALVGCQSKQMRSAKLQDEYSKAHKQYYDDCVAPAYGGTDTYFKGAKPMTMTQQEELAHQQKCVLEAKRAGDLQSQLQAASQ